MVYIWIGFCTAGIVYLLGKVYRMKYAIKEIYEQLPRIVHEDTHSLLTISSRDRQLQQLASTLNQELRELRKMAMQYHNGNQQLQEAIMDISHDIRTPQTAIQGFIQLLEKEELSAIQASYLAIIKNRSQDLATLFEQLFALSIGYDEHVLVTPEVCCLQQLLEEAIVSYYVLLKQKQIEPVIEMVEEPVYITADKRMLLRVFDNLISNALKYTDGDFQIQLKKQRNMIFSNHAKDLDVVSVSRMFHRYYTVDTQKQSTGLGLSIAKQLVERNGGMIHAEYKEGALIVTLQMPQ